MNDNKMPHNPLNGFSSQLKYIKIFLPNRSAVDESADDSESDWFVGRNVLMDKLYNWLADKKDKGSYLITGYRGMGKTSMVNRVMQRLTREINYHVELYCYISLGLLLFFIFGFIFNAPWFNLLRYFCLAVSVAILLYVSIIYKNLFRLKEEKKINDFPNAPLFLRKLIKKVIIKLDVSKKSYHNIKININLGHEVIKERDILCLIAVNIKDKYHKYIKGIQPRFPFVFIITSCVGMMSVGIVKVLTKIYSNILLVNDSDFSLQAVSDILNVNNISQNTWFSRLMSNIWNIVNIALTHYPNLFKLLTFTLVTILVWNVMKWLACFLPKVSTHQKTMKRLKHLCIRLSSTLDEEDGGLKNMEKNVVSISLLGRRKRRVYPVANIREIESELIEIVNSINSNDCLPTYRAEFFVVFDELDKIDPDIVDRSKETAVPEFTDAVKGFPGGIDSRERRKNVLKLLANIKLFISTAKAKFVFISGRELYDAFLADLSDRDFAISSIFNGVINVDSFLSPEGGQTDVRSMSEWFVANRLLPDSYLKRKVYENADKKVLKKEMPSLKWYYEYLMEQLRKDNTNYIEKQKDIEYVIIFLHTFSAYLTHISNGSPKKIVLYFEKYVKRNIDTLSINDWDDTIEVGKDTRADRQEVLYFDYLQQQNINFIHYLANPIMSTITNDLSKFGDRYLVSLSFIIDHIYKHHNRSFSWRNMEQIPELLKTSKAPELRESVTSIMEFLLQIHISRISIGLNEYKFHKSISEEISYMSKISDEVSAIFNFTLDESLAVIRHNTMLLKYYMELSKNNEQNRECYNDYRGIMARIHSNIGDLHFWDEDYYSATLEYRMSINLNENERREFHGNNANDGSFLTMIRCNLKLGMTYEYRKIYSNAYQIYCNLISQLIERRSIDERELGLDMIEERVDDWRMKRPVIVDGMVRNNDDNDRKGDLRTNNIGDNFYDDQQYRQYKKQFYHRLQENNVNFLDNDIHQYQSDLQNIEYSTDFDGVITGFSADLTPEKARMVSRITLFEEVRYVYQVILAKLFVVEKMVMSGITQTNINVAEAEFRTLHRTINMEEKFLVSADFFCKLAEILYYKNSLTILSKNQNSLYAAIYFGDFDLMANLDDFCFFTYRESNHHSNAHNIKRDVKFFFEHIDAINVNDSKNPYFDWKNLSNNVSSLFDGLLNNLDHYYEILSQNELFPLNLDMDNAMENVKAYLEYNQRIYDNRRYLYTFNRMEPCCLHRYRLQNNNLRPSCYACKYYNRSLRILIKNMIVGNFDEMNNMSKSLSLLKFSFKKHLRYTRINQIITLAKSIEGFGNVLFSCSSLDIDEGDNNKLGKGISPNLIRSLSELANCNNEEGEIDKIKELLDSNQAMTRLDKAVLYYWDACRYYLIISQYDEAINCLNKVITVLTYYIGVTNYYKMDDEKAWQDESDTIEALIGENNEEESFLNVVFRMIVRFTGFQYDNAGLTEIHEFKWLLSKDNFEKVDLSKLSLYPNIRSAFLRILEIRTQGLSYLAFKNNKSQSDYRSFILRTYPRIAPSRRYATTFYEEVLGYYTKVRYNCCIINDMFGGNVLLDTDNKLHYSTSYQLAVLKAFANYLSNDISGNKLDSLIFDVKDNVRSKLDLLEYIIHDSILCLTNMIQVFTPHNHMTSYSRSFIAITYNYLWEWSQFYELLYDMYDYRVKKMHQENDIALDIVDRIYGAFKGNSENHPSKQELIDCMNACCKAIPESIVNDTKYGDLCSRLYSKLRHDVDDVTINSIFSNFSAEMAVNYYYMAEETNTEGDTYKDLIGMLFYLNDDLNNDTCEFNLACERFLLNCGIIQNQKLKLHELYKDSNVYKLSQSYIDGYDKVWNQTKTTNKNRFNRSLYINSEY